LLHIDALRLPKFDRPGHWATGDRRQRARASKRDTVVIGVIDDHTRLVYAELHSAENADTVTATLTRAISWFAEQGCGAVRAVMSDNAMAYTNSTSFQALLARHGARHITPPPYTPRWNGKIERWFQTAKREWSHGRIWQNSRQRDRALSSFLRFYNRQRPHSAAAGRAPLTRVHQAREQDS
jgi:transposase InsO family protein